MKHATLIYNPVAGRHPARRERQIRAAAKVLHEAGIEVDLAPTTGPGVARDLARAAVNEGEALVLACGGDGTVNEVLNGLVPGNTTLGILPGGTANIIGKELRLPHDPIQAACELSTWKPRRIALGKAIWGGALPSAEKPTRYFISVAGIGFDAYIVHSLSWSLKMGWGVLGYALEALRATWRYSFPAFRIQVDGADHQATFAVIHRAGHYAGWFPLAPKASVFKPDFSACLFQSRSGARYVLYALAVLMRQHARLADVKLVEGFEIACSDEQAGKAIYFELDGELVGELPATFDIVPDALTVLAP